MGSECCDVNLGQDFHVGSPCCSCQFLHHGHFPESFAVRGTDVGRPDKFPIAFKQYTKKLIFSTGSSC